MSRGLLKKTFHEGLVYSKVRIVNIIFIAVAGNHVDFV